METDLAEPRIPVSVYPPIQLTMSQRRARRASLTGDAARRRLFDYIVAYKESHDGNSPSSREMADGANICSTSVVHFHLRTLESQGKITRPRGSSRGIVVVGGSWRYHATKRVLPEHS